MEPIHTINARGNVLLEVVRDYFGLTSFQMRREIVAMHETLVSILKSKGINYGDLRPALVPSTSRYEAGFLFDVETLNEGFYGRKAARWILKLLDPRTTQSLRCGDLIAPNQEIIRNIVTRHLVAAKPFTFSKSTILFCIYLNNLSSSMQTRLHVELKTKRGYVGYLPATFASSAKTFLSMTLISCGLKYGRKVIMGHEDDVPNEENRNLGGFPYAACGYEELSLQEMYHDVFLAYKIEREVYGAFEVDSEMSLNAISDEIGSLKNFEVVIEDAKHGYLLSEKGGKLAKAGIAQLDRNELEKMIRAKIAANYIYSLQYLEAHKVSKFNLMLEVAGSDDRPPTRLNGVFQYLPKSKQLRLITMY